MKPESKFILLDTNILITLSKSKKNRTKLSRSVFRPLKRRNCSFYIIEGVYFEFLRNANTLTEYKKLKTLIDEFSKIPSSLNEHKTAINLSNLYFHKNAASKKQISYVDCLLGAQLVKYKGKVALLTTNYRDFPSCIFDRIEVKAINLEKEILTLAYIIFNKDKYQQCREDFLRSG